ncbi:MAG: hypothetical protein JNK94_10270 [Hyphomonadaceae bacterium]|nr:hypothetical protein [Hyphomonadaceae bacterium]
MPNDNVTPFRRPPRRAPAPQQPGGLGFKTHRGKAMLVQALTLAAFLVNFFFPAPPWSFIGLAIGIAAVVLAYTNRGQAMPWANTHHEHALRTLVIGYAIWVLASLLTYVHGALAMATFYIQIVVVIWAGLRAGVGLIFAGLRKAIPNPQGWFI